MNFLHPDRLLLLVAVIALVVAYVAAQIRHHQAVERYTNPAMLDLLAPERDRGVVRHLSPVLALVALGALVVAIAQPTRAEAVPRNQGVVVLAIDVSASMAATDIAPSRLEAAKSGAIDFVKGLRKGLHVGLVSFDRNASLLVAPTLDRANVTEAITGLGIGPGTAAGEGIETSLAAAQSVLSPDLLASNKDLPASIVLLSDGATTVGRSAQSAAADAAAARVAVTTISFGTSDGVVNLGGDVVRVPADPQTMAEVAAITGARSFQATSAGELKDVYDDISTAVGTTTEPREVTRTWLGVAAIALAASAAVALSRGRVL